MDGPAAERRPHGEIEVLKDAPQLQCRWLFHRGVSAQNASGGPAHGSNTAAQRTEEICCPRPQRTIGKDTNTVLAACQCARHAAPFCAGGHRQRLRARAGRAPRLAVKTLPLPCASTAFEPKGAALCLHRTTLPLPCVSTAFVPKGAASALRLRDSAFALRFRCRRGEDTAFALRFRCRRREDTAFALRFRCFRGEDTAFDLRCRRG